MKTLVNSLLAAILTAALLPGCAPSGMVAATGPAPADGSVAAGDGPGASVGCTSTACGSGMLCYQNSCVVALGSCSSDADCLDDSFCHQGRCLPYGAETRTVDPGCSNDGFKPEAFSAPQVACKWTDGQSISTPVVADLDRDGIPEILLVTDVDGHLVALRGDSCDLVFDRPAGLHWCSHLAVADLTGDSVPEIVGITASNVVVVFDNKGDPIAQAQAPAKAGMSQTICSGASIANLDGQGVPEIVYGGMALRLTGGKLETLYDVAVPNACHGLITAVADVDLDGAPEVLTGNRILDGLTGADKTPAPAIAWSAGYVAVAQFDPVTPEPEIVLLSSQEGGPATIRIYHPKTGAVVFGPYHFGVQWGGAPTVADFDGDGQPEVGAASRTSYTVFDPECGKQPMPASCQGPGVRWSRPIVDSSSGATGSAVFDFNGDGRAEVVYRDECWLRVYDGASGKVLFGQPITNGTATESPVIADVNADGHAEIVVPASYWKTACAPEQELGLPHGGFVKGIYVLKDAADRWMPSRPIWNQHAYHITNVEDDGTVPLKEKNSWEGWNSYRQNAQGMVKKPIPGIDMTARQHTAIEASADCSSAWLLQAEICNRGPAKAPAGISGTFYSGDPRAGGAKICTGSTTDALGPGSCVAVRCSYGAPPQHAVDLWFVADDPGTGPGGQTECREDNNLLHLPGSLCKDNLVD